ncbi:D-amino acid oxidase [Maublancomyces gigas]|uniref:D-amino acid oxidase n=1 Tax=Discina gigas TaxID=1032678 RepID=A0ABR3GHS7_9PEZI
MPGDYDIEYTSPWAGANYMPVSPKGSRAAEWDRVTVKELYRLAASVPEAGIHFQDVVIYNREKDKQSSTAAWFNELLSREPWFKDVVSDFRELLQSELPTGVTSGTRWKSVCINTPVYLAYLVSQCLKNGVVFKRGVLKHISEAASLHALGNKVDIVVNCTGIMASKLGGVEDKTVYPARGQIVLVRNVAPAMYANSGTDDGDDEAMYIMTRAAGGGTILGGSYQKHSWESKVDLNLADRIMKRAIEWCPELVKPGQGIEGLDVISHGVGLRPLRVGGPRVEKDVIDGLKVVHNYGAGGFGYQSSYGMSEETARLVEESLRHRAML